MLAFEMRMCSGVGWRNGRNSSVLDVLGLSGWSMEHRERRSRKQLDMWSAVQGEGQARRACPEPCASRQRVVESV